MKWSIKEDEIVCNFYLTHKNSCRRNFLLLMQELKKEGFPNRDESSTKMRLANYSFLDNGKGLSNASKQSLKVFQKNKHICQGGNDGKKYY